MLKRTLGSVGLPNQDPGRSTPHVPSFEDIYKQYFDFVWASARHLGSERDVVDDVVQDVFIVIHSKLATLQQPESLRSWIYGIARRVASDYRRSKRTREFARATLGAELRMSQPAPPSPHEIAEWNADLELLESVLAKLGDQKREVFVMVEILEMTVPEVARALEIPLDTAYSRLRRARQSFDEALVGQEVHNEGNGGQHDPSSGSCAYGNLLKYGLRLRASSI